MRVCGEAAFIKRSQRAHPHPASPARAGEGKSGHSGNALLYVMLAVGLLAALTFAYVQDSRDSYGTQSAVQIAASLYSQVNMIKAAIVQCSLEYPGGVASYGSTNPPYPFVPTNNANAAAGCTTTSNATGCIANAANNDVMNLACLGAPIGAAYMFQGASNQGRFLPPPAAGITAAGSGSGWTYGNDLTQGGLGGVYIQTTSSGDAASSAALSRLVSQFTSTQASLSGLTFTAWIQNNN